MQRIRQFGAQALRAIGKPDKDTILRQGAAALIAALAAAVPLPHAAVALAAAMTAAENRDGAYPPVTFAGACVARVAVGTLTADPFVWYDAAAFALVCALSYANMRFGQSYRRVPDGVLAALAVVLSRVFAIRLLALDWIILGVQAGCAFLMCPVFAMAAAVASAPGGRKLLKFEETLSVCFSLSILLAGMAQLRLFTVSPAVVASFFMIMLVASVCGAPLAAACGAVTGLALAAGLSGQWALIGNVAVCAVVAGLFGKLGRWAAVLSFILTNALLTLAVNGSREIILPLKETLPAALCVMLIPKKFMARFAAAVSEDSLSRREDLSTAQRVSRAVQYRLCGVADVFGQMATCFSSVAMADDNPPDAQTAEMMRRVSSDVCRSCALTNICWKREYESTFDAMEDALEKARQNGRFEASMLRPAFARRCMHAGRMTECVNRLAGFYALETKWERRLDESRMLVAGQLSGVSRVMRGMADELTIDVFEGEHTERDVRVAFDKRGLQAPTSVTAFKGAGGWEVRVACDRAGDRLRCAREGPQAVGEALGCPMRMSTNLCDLSENKSCVCVYSQSVKYDLICGRAQRPAFGQEACGDSCAVEQITPGLQLLALSDGMGNGEIAAAESSATVRLLVNFAKAGFGRDVALEAINKLLLLRSGAEMFSTVDMCCVDCATGAAELTKIAAAPCLVMKKGRLRRVEAEALPLGIADAAIPAAIRFDLESGDGVILMSDGVVDALGDAALPALCLALWKDSAGEVQSFCNMLVEAAAACNSDMPRDDMTVVAGFLTESDRVG